MIIIRYIVDLLYNKFYIRFKFKLNETKMYIISSVAQYLNKSVNENYGNNAFTIILYEISLLISSIENSSEIDESINNINIQIPNKKISDVLGDIVVNRRLPYMSKYLFHFKTRRILCYLCKEKLYELYSEFRPKERKITDNDIEKLYDDKYKSKEIGKRIEEEIESGEINESSNS